MTKEKREMINGIIGLIQGLKMDEDTKNKMVYNKLFGALSVATEELKIHAEDTDCRFGVPTEIMDLCYEALIFANHNDGDNNNNPIHNIKLLPCPFCGHGETRVDENLFTYRTSSQILSASVTHLCTKDVYQSSIIIRAKTKEEAINLWNTRAGQ